MPTIKPKNRMQEMALRSNCDIVALTGAMGSGKSFLISWLTAYYVQQNLGAGFFYVRRNEDNFKGSGGLFSCFEKLYPLDIRMGADAKNAEIKRNSIGTFTKSRSATVRFNNGYLASFMAAYTDDQSKIENLFKSKQADKIVYDECDTMIWKTISYSTSRIRGGKLDGLKRQLILVQNPERECFMRRICAKDKDGKGWINEDGSVDAKMNGVVRFFVNPDGEESNIIWGDTKEEVYEKAKEWIDSKIKPFMGKIKPLEMVRSFVFYDMPILTDDADYIATLASSTASSSGFDVNWNYSKTDAKDDELNLEVKSHHIANMFRPSRNTVIKKRFMTVDYAGTSNAAELGDKGRSDNCVCFAWELGDVELHCFDIAWEVRPTPQKSRELIRRFRDKHFFTGSEVVFDAQGGGDALSIDFPSARRFECNKAPSNRGAAKYNKMRDESMGITKDMILAGLISIEPSLANITYTHSRMRSAKNKTTILSHCQFESRGLVFHTMKTNKIAADDKETIKKTVLKGYSPDLMDNIYMANGAFIYQAYKLLSDKGNVATPPAFNITIGNTPFIPQKKRISSFNNKIEKLFQW